MAKMFWLGYQLPTRMIAVRTWMSDFGNSPETRGT